MNLYVCAIFIFVTNGQHVGKVLGEKETGFQSLMAGFEFLVGYVNMYVLRINDHFP